MKAASNTKTTIIKGNVKIKIYIPYFTKLSVKGQILEV